MIFDNVSKNYIKLKPICWNSASNIKQVLEVAPDKAAAVRPLITHHENYPS